MKSELEDYNYSYSGCMDKINTLQMKGHVGFIGRRLPKQRMHTIVDESLYMSACITQNISRTKQHL
jgi:hypothetical protein